MFDRLVRENMAHSLSFDLQTLNFKSICNSTSQIAVPNKTGTSLLKLMVNSILKNFLGNHIRINVNCSHFKLVYSTTYLQPIALFLTAGGVMDENGTE